MEPLGIVNKGPAGREAVVKLGTVRGTLGGGCPFQVAWGDRCRGPGPGCVADLKGKSYAELLASKVGGAAADVKATTAAKLGLAGGRWWVGQGQRHIAWVTTHWGLGQVGREVGL